MDIITHTIMIFVRGFQDINSIADFGIWLFQVVGIIAFIYLILLKVGLFDVCYKKFGAAACVFSVIGVIIGLIQDSFISGQLVALSILLIGVPFRLYLREDAEES